MVEKMIGFMWFIILLALNHGAKSNNLNAEALLSRIEQLEWSNRRMAERLDHLEQLSRLIAPRTCEELKQQGLTQSGVYEIDPDGRGIGDAPFPVFCDMDSGTTEVFQNSTASASQIDDLMYLSGTCKPHIKSGQLVLQCRGEPTFSPGGSCDDLRKAGEAISGYYLVRPPNSAITEVVFCDMTGSVPSSRAQNSFGPVAMQAETSTVMFDVSLKTPCSSYLYGYNSFCEPHLSRGGGINPEKGTFTAPVAGTYLFTIHGQMYPYATKSVYITQNGEIRGRIQANSQGQNEYDMVSQTVILQVAVGDVIQVYSNPCVTLGGTSYSHFIGILLHGQ